MPHVQKGSKRSILSDGEMWSTKESHPKKDSWSKFDEGKNGFVSNHSKKFTINFYHKIRFIFWKKSRCCACENEWKVKIRSERIKVSLKFTRYLKIACSYRLFLQRKRVVSSENTSLLRKLPPKPLSWVKENLRFTLFVVFSTSTFVHFLDFWVYHKILRTNDSCSNFFASTQTCLVWKSKFVAEGSGVRICKPQAKPFEISPKG